MIKGAKSQGFQTTLVVLQRGKELVYRFTANWGCACIEGKASMGESWGGRGKGILKAEFQMCISTRGKLHTEIFWQNVKGTEMKAQPGICIANDICPGGAMRTCSEIRKVFCLCLPEG